VPALAADPVGGCPTGYELFQLPPLPEAPAGHAVDARGNQDGYICFKAYPNPDHPGGFNLIDNRLQSGN
jgi:hypothetical protein